MAIKVVSIAGTPVDTRMGADFLREKAFRDVKPDIDMIGMGHLAIVLDIEAGLAPEEIIERQALKELGVFFKKAGAEVWVLGCTHFPYLKEALQKQIELPLIDPADEMYELLLKDALYKTAIQKDGFAEPSFFLRFSQQDLQRLQQILMHHVRGVEMGHVADQLQDGARQGYAQDGADAELTTQQPPYEGHDAPHDHRHGPDGNHPEALAQRYQQRIPWTAAQPLGDIDTHGSVHYDKA